MKRKKLLASLLSFILVFTSIIPEISVYANVEGTTVNTEGMQISKTATANNDGKTYKITLEAYATGSKVITQTKRDVPTDIVLVLDQSGSMDNYISTVNFEPYKDKSGWGGTDYNTRNQDHYENRHNGGKNNLWYKLADGSYVSVSVVRKEEGEYNPISNQTNGYYYNNINNLYDMVDNTPIKVNVERSGNSIWGYTYTYTREDGVSLGSGKGKDTSPTFTNENEVLYLLENVKENYTYSYTNNAGSIVVIGTSVGATTTFSTTLYEKVTSTNSTTKLEALQEAVTQFVNNVSTKALGTDGKYGTEDDVNHRIAVVGFASTKGGYSNTYNNTELLSTSTVVNYANANDTNYQDALVSVNGSNGTLNSRLSTAISRLDASGDTYLEYGMDMANKVFAQYPIAAGDTTGRKRVVVVFTDGYPAPSGTNTFNYSMANNAISNAKTTKNTYGATVYTVGVLDDADPTASITENFKNNGTSTAQQTVASNRYMHYVSTNYPNATSLTDGGALSSDANPFAGGKSYYLSATDSSALNNIFYQISSNIEMGGSTATLGEESVIKDIIAPAFKLTNGANTDSIIVETYSCKGKKGDVYTWSKNATAMGATVSINTAGDKIDVSGFDFAENYVGTVTNANGSVDYRGHKLVISFDVTAKDGFLGGNNVYTNTSAGVYEKATDKDPVLTFERPQVNVPIGNVTVTAQDKNVYLLGNLTADQLQSGAAVNVGNTTLNMAANNYGLETWQNEYVNINYKDANGNSVNALNSLVADTSYNMSVTVDPISDGTGASGTVATAKTGSDSANVSVFKPQLTFKDSTVWYGDTAPTSYDGNLASTVWLHGTTNATSVTMTGTAPTIEKVCTPDSSKISYGKINSKQDINVDVTAKIGTTDITDYTTFLHKDCTGKTNEVPAGKDGAEFLLHVNTCQLTVQKTGGNANEPYVITVMKKDGDEFKKYTELTLMGGNPNKSTATIFELPVGEYSIEENTKWSWRYNPTYSSDSVTLDSNTSSGTITCTNTPNNNIYWLNGFSEVVKNIFGVSKASN